MSGGGIFDEGRFALVRDKEMWLAWIDLTRGLEKSLGVTPRAGITTFDFHPGLGLLAVAGWWDSILVFDVAGGQHWTLPVIGEGSVTVQCLFDPVGRWLISSHRDQIRAWKLPLDPLFGDLGYRDLLDNLGSLTNVRIDFEEDISSKRRVTNSLELQGPKVFLHTNYNI